jgi:opacity protein-like surface antigen
MRKLLLAAGMAVALAAGATSANALTIVGPVYGSDGSATGTYGDNFTVSGGFTSTITFVLAQAGKLSSSITTSFAGGGTNIDFTTATLNGHAFTLSPHGDFEFGSIGQTAVLAGLQTIVVTGTSGNNGSFAGQFSFSPSVPEATTWGMMVLGVGAMGAVMRRRRTAAVVAA